MDDYGPWIRIALRIVAGILIGKGLFGDDAYTWAADPDVVYLVEIAAAAIIWGISEYYYKLAKRFGWPT